MYPVLTTTVSPSMPQAYSEVSMENHALKRTW